MTPILVVLTVLVYAPPAGRAGDRSQDVARALTEALRAGGAEVVDGPVDAARVEHARGWVPEEALAFFARGRALVEDGRRALERVELAEAVAKLEAAEAVYAPERDRAGVPALLAQAALLRGRALYDLGRVEEARATFRRAAALDPTQRLTEAMVRPQLVRVAAEAAQAAGPADALPPLEPRPDPTPAALEAVRTRPSEAGARALAETLGLDGVVFAAVALDRGRLAIAAQRRDERGCATEVVTGEDARALGRRVLEAETRCGPSAEVTEAEPIARPRPVEPSPPPPPRKKSIWKRPWIYLGALAVTSVVVGLAAGLPAPAPRARVTVDGTRFSLEQLGLAP